MGILMYKQGKLEEAEPYYREVLEGRRRVLGDEHPETLRSIYNMGVTMIQQGKLDEAEALVREALRLKPGDKEHQTKFGKFLDLIEEARKEKAAEDPEPKENGGADKDP